MPKVSVVIPYYNSEKTILRALNSVINQTYTDYEIILVDDGSKDNSYNVVQTFIYEHKEYNMENIYQHNAGPSKARNTGINKSNGEYIALLDSDDSWDINKLKIQMDFIKKNKNILILGSNYNIIQNNRVVVKGKNTGRYIEVNFYKRLFKNYFSTPTVIIKKSIIKEFGGFDEKQKYAEDSLLFIKILRKYRGGKIETPLVNLYKEEFGTQGLSADLRNIEKWELNNFKTLYKANNMYSKRINFFLYLCVIIFSYFKYLRRIIIVKLRRKSD